MIQSELEAIISPVVESFDCQLWGLNLLPGNHTLLRIYIDKDDGVTIDDCEKISKQLSTVLDVEDPFVNNYILEVSSPGLDRQLFKSEHYQKYVGSVVSIVLKTPFEARKKFQGLLNNIENDEIAIQIEDTEYQFPVESIHKAKVVPF